MEPECLLPAKFFIHQRMHHNWIF